MIGQTKTQGGLLLVIALLALVTHPSSASENEKEPSPEPYSFSYNAESNGGFSSHQESGDGSGRVQGFYIIMGEDNRERRVDYVADENGYRASISTNEVGTRSESTADAQYNARLPSKEQLDQAKVTAEEYKFLEDQHAAERERQLSRSSQQVQQQQLAGQNSQRWSSSSSNQQSGQSSASGSQRWTPTQSVNARQPQQYDQANSTTTSTDAVDDEGWRRSAKLLAGANQQFNQRQYSSQQQSQVASLIPPVPQVVNQVQKQNQISKTNSQQLPPQRSTANFVGNFAQDQPMDVVATVTTAKSTVPLGAEDAGGAQVSQELKQQTQQPPAWQSAPRSTQPVGMVVNPGLQQQFMLQFMQQANQLTAQDYPRKPSQPNFQERIQPKQQQQQQPNVNVAALPQEQKQQKMVIDEPVSLNVNSVASQSPRWQTNVDVADQRQAQEQSPVNQQQSNIIDEVSGEQIDNQQVTTGSENTREANQSYTSATPVEVNQAEPIGTTQLVIPMRQQQQQRPQPQQAVQQPYETTTGQPAPSGFLAINVGQQEVETRPLMPTNDYQMPDVTSQRVAEQIMPQQNTQQVDTNYQRKNVYQEQQQQRQRPMSIQQIIQDGEKQQEVEQEAARPTTTTTQSPSSSVFTTSRELETTTTFQPIVETTRTPIQTTARTTTSTTTTTTTTTRPSVAQQQNQQTFTTAIPYRVSYAQSTVPTPGSLNTLLMQTTRRPAPINQQQLIGGTKGGAQGVKRVILGPRYTTTAPATSSRLIEQNLARETPSIPTSTLSTNEPYITTTTTTTTTQTPDYAREMATSEAPEFVDRQQQQQQEQKETQKVPQELERRPDTYPSYNGQQQQAVTTSEYSTTARPVRVETVSPKQPSYSKQPQQQWQQQQWKGGVKGGNRPAGRRQFWQMQQQPPVTVKSRASSLSDRQFAAPNAVVNQKSQASVDYATPTDFGLRIQGR